MIALDTQFYPLAPPFSLSLMFILLLACSSVLELGKLWYGRKLWVADQNSKIESNRSSSVSLFWPAFSSVPKSEEK